MPARRNARPRSRHHLMIDDDIWDFYSSLYGPDGARAGVGLSEAVNAVLRGKMNELRSRIDEANDRLAKGTAV